METVSSADGTTIAYDRSGEGPTLVLVDGAIQHRAIDRFGPELSGLLAPRFTVVRYDRRGRGDSGDTPPYAIEREVEDLGALIDAVGSPAFVSGLSSGGVLALEAAARGLPISKLAAYEPPFVVDDTRPPLPRDYVARLTELAATDRRGDAVEYFMTTAVGMPAEVVAGMRGAPFWPALEGVAHTIAYDGTFMLDVATGRPEPLRKWAGLSVPTLVMDGGDSPPWLRNAARALADVLPDARHETLAGQTHEVAPAVLAPVLEGFFAG